MFGHRGSPRAGRENTLASLTLALGEQADGFETDLRRLNDGAIVLFHEPDVAGVPLSTMTLDALRQRVPDVALLSDLTDLRGRGKMILEVKEEGFEEDLVAAIRDWPDVVVCSFSHSIIERLANRDGGFELGLTVREYRMDLVPKIGDYDARWFFPRWDVIDEELVDALHRRNVKVVPWTANRSTQWDRLDYIGCDGVMTDVPAGAVKWRGVRSLKR